MTGPGVIAQGQHVYRRRKQHCNLKTGLQVVCAAVFLLGMARFAQAADPDLPIFNPNLTVDVTNTIFAGGALGNGISNSAAAIQAAINMVSTSVVAGAGGGTVRVRAVGMLTNYLCGVITLKSNVNLLVDSGTKLQMLPRSNWVGSIFIIGATNASDIQISGTGTIDGNGAFTIPGVVTNWWGDSGKKNFPSGRPNLIQFNHNKRVQIRDVTIQNAPTFHIMAHNSNGNMTFQNMTINTAGDSPNTDGIDLASTNVLFRNCFISDGDDNIQIGSSSAAANNITISNCTFGTGHGVSIGSPTQDGVNNLLVSNCTWNGTEYGIKIKTDRGIGGVIQNLQYRDLVMSNVNFVIAFYMYYNSMGSPSSSITNTPASAAGDPVQTITSTTPSFLNITISNVTASVIGGNIAGIIYGLPESLVSNVTMSKVNISAPGKTFSIFNAQGIQIIDSNLSAPNTTSNTLTLFHAQITVTNAAANTNVFTVGGLAAPATNALSFFNGLATITDTNELGGGPITLGDSTLTFSQDSITSSNTPVSIVTASTIAFTSGSNILSGTLTGPGPLAFNLGGAVLTLPGPNIYSGGTTVSNGTLLVNNTSGSGTGTGAVTVVGGATLGGKGVIGGPVTVNGILSPGNTPGTLTISNDLAVGGGAVLQYELGTNSDLTVVSGNLTLGGTLNVTDAGGFTTNTYTLVTYAGALTYNGLTIGAVPNTNFTYTISTSTVHQVKLIVSGVSGTAPVASFTASPTSGTEPLTVNFTDTSTGTSPLSLFWNLGDASTTNTAGGAGFAHTYAAGIHTVTLTASNSLGTSTLVSNNLITVITAWQAWQLQYFGCTNCPQATGEADPLGKGMSNTNQFLAGLNPTNSASLFRIISVAPQGGDVAITWTAGAGRTNAVQASQGDASGGYTNAFGDVSGLVIIPGNNADVTTNFVDGGGATNGPSRFYRIRLVP